MTGLSHRTVIGPTSDVAHSEAGWVTVCCNDNAVGYRDCKDLVRRLILVYILYLDLAWPGPSGIDPIELNLELSS